MCIESIYRHIRGIPADEIFTTREMLIYGSRAAVDSSLSKMVHDQFIFRLARGVFIRDTTVMPTAEQIVSAKSRAWGTRIARHAEGLQDDFHITEGPTKKISLPELVGVPRSTASRVEFL